jgi:predicted homoserine dehydrogenase-like protein
MTVWSRHRELVERRGPITVGVIGAGYVGTGLVHLLHQVEGFRPAVVVNRTIDRAIGAYFVAGYSPADVVVARSGRDLDAAIEAGKPAVAEDADLAIALDSLDVLVETTGALDYGAEVTLAALRAGRAVVSINAEVDVALGWLLHQTAANHGGIYTICDGDQPGVLMRTLEHVRSMGFEPLVAVNCKRHLDVRQTPGTSAPYSARDGTRPEMTTATGDGTKMNIEQAVLANLTGMPPDCRGMHGVPTTLEHAVRDVLAAVSRAGVVEYTLGGDFGSGVFVIGRAPDHAAVERSLRFYKMGDGPEYLFLRPYHMVQFEMPLSIAEVVLDREPLWKPVAPPVADVFAVAKDDLQPGHTLDGIGGYHCYGQIDTVERGREYLSITLAHHARLIRPVARDEPIPLDAVELDESGPIVRLRREQDDLLVATAGVRP